MSNYHNLVITKLPNASRIFTEFMSEVIPFRGFSLHDQVAERVRALIFDHQIGPGAFIEKPRKGMTSLINSVNVRDAFSNSVITRL